MENNTELEEEKKEILRRYRGLLRSASKSISASDKKTIRKAFDIALEAHSGMRRKSGEPYIYHPLAVARIVAEEMGLDTVSIACALLHDTVEDTYITLDDIENVFDTKTKDIIDGLTKISGVFDHSTSAQAENFRKMLLTLSDDIRVILIKLADRLHNMRTLGSMPKAKQLKIASETSFMYAPLAHRLGLYKVKTELEDLSLKYQDPEVYQTIAGKLKSTKAARTRFVNQFIQPLKDELDKQGFKAEIKGRPKSIFSIYNKIQTKHITFEEIYDVFAIRITIDEDELPKEKAEIWRAYSIVTDFYQPNPDRLRDWVSMPKANGYESLHTTVMSSKGQWVEVQIRTKRMDEVAEKGFAAHWKYKENTNANNKLDIWLAQVREILENESENSLDFIDNFKLNLYSEEIFVFTPDGDLKTLPKGATALDFAFHIHTQVGSRCMGAKVNSKLVPLSHGLISGDQIEIITSKNQSPKEDWLNYANTARAKQKIKSSLKEEKKKIATDGKEILRRKFKSLDVEFLSVNIAALEEHFHQDSITDLYYNIAKGSINLKKLKGHTVEGGRLIFKKEPIKRIKSPRPDKATPDKHSIPGKKDVLLIGDEQQKLDYELAVCCDPVSGDDVFGFVTSSGTIKIHRSNCKNAVELLSNYNYRVMKAIWSSKEKKKFSSRLKFTGIDDIGLVHNVTKAISEDLNVNMKSISFDSNDGIFDGLVKVEIHNLDHLSKLMERLREVTGVLTVDRMKEEE
ncbi:MAG TPA: RelA/SpoT family protein [Flavobacteriales bacterium]|nr:RelA/SpoT family protein [Flavobacteriales bacterium]|tara:strand:+ start:14983 stop:17208 length:2226 start_codon:yes stop_codon:yes gene_type:complete